MSLECACATETESSNSSRIEFILLYLCEIVFGSDNFFYEGMAKIFDVTIVFHHLVELFMSLALCIDSFVGVSCFSLEVLHVIKPYVQRTPKLWYLW